MFQCHDILTADHTTHTSLLMFDTLTMTFVRVMIPRQDVI